ncbi:glycoside hydrolase family 3 N-terminal domain-containing protein [Humibacter ginsenosidimutans]|uniref:Beta-N-acetylhexosaminidase n=1 Tax=Humibacter ginsenosidimutans TaxID=2599293 RepID=A0A5B8M3H7_9MICO|nr:glycoside hydrolase family 3 N-terminal domain-containing protein [Humibacter ginsenosidimutans]QDZ15348.1 beta-N-acetylhexosaminidase [Humibacter ginsenosidimutans]
MNSASSPSEPVAGGSDERDIAARGPRFSRRSVLAAGVGAAAGAALAGAGAASAFAAPASETAMSGFSLPWWLRLSPRQQVAQRVIFSYPGATPPDALLEGIAQGEVGGVIFFGENITSLTQIASVVAQLRAAQASSPVKEPLLLMTDQEGGYIRRLSGQEPVLSEKQIGLAADPDAAATAAGSGAAGALKNVGMNLNLAPVLDVFRTPGNFDDQWERSYSSDPVLAGRLGADFVRAQQGAGVAATAKHFPGLGAATADENTDLGPVTLTQGLSELRNVDEAAFSPAIKAGVKLVMASWATYPAIDATYPAGLSLRMIELELRARLGFSGVTITDALEAGALTAFGDTGNRALLAAKAGMDILLCSARDYSQGTDAVDALTTAVQKHTLDPLRFIASLQRVQNLRSRVS